MKSVWLIFTVFLLSMPLAFAQNSEMIIKLNENEPAHITISVENPSNAAELRTIIREQSIRDIYQQRFGLVFSSVKNLELSVDSGIFVIEFDASIVNESNDQWIIEKKDFNDNIDTMSTIAITLPRDAVLESSDPEPNKIFENVLEWHDVDFIPDIRYTKRDTHSRKGLVAATIVLSILAIAYFTVKKRK